MSHYSVRVHYVMKPSTTHRAACMTALSTVSRWWPASTVAKQAAHTRSCRGDGVTFPQGATFCHTQDLDSILLPGGPTFTQPRHRQFLEVRKLVDFVVSAFIINTPMSSLITAVLVKLPLIHLGEKSHVFVLSFVWRLGF